MRDGIDLIEIKSTVSSKVREILEHFIDFSWGCGMPHGLCCNDLHCLHSETEVVSWDYANRDSHWHFRQVRLQPSGSEHSKIIHGLYSCDTVMFTKN